MTWKRSVPLRQIVQEVAPAARIAAVSSAGTSRCAASYSSMRSARTLVCRAILMSVSVLGQQALGAQLLPELVRDLAAEQGGGVAHLVRGAGAHEHSGDGRV